jgi:hypothetical protein
VYDTLPDTLADAAMHFPRAGRNLAGANNIKIAEDWLLPRSHTHTQQCAHETKGPVR